MTILGALLGGAVMLRLGLWRSLVAVWHLASGQQFGFCNGWPARAKGQLGQLLIPSFDWGFVHLSHATPWMAACCWWWCLENLSSGMGTRGLLWPSS